MGDELKTPFIWSVEEVEASARRVEAMRDFLVSIGAFDAAMDVRNVLAVARQWCEERTSKKPVA